MIDKPIYIAALLVHVSPPGKHTEKPLGEPIVTDTVMVARVEVLPYQGAPQEEKQETCVSALSRSGPNLFSGIGLLPQKQ